MLTLNNLKPILNTEQLFVIALARAYLHTNSTPTAYHFTACHRIEFDKLLGLGKQHGINSFLYSTITAFNIPADTDYIDALRNHSLQCTVQSLYMQQSASKLIEAVKEKYGITIIPYKGITLSKYYKQPAYRESVDIDFLIKETDIDLIEDFFIAEQYKARHTVKRTYLPFYKKWFKDIVYTFPAAAVSQQFSIEMHWHLTDRFAGKMPGYHFFYNNNKLNEAEKDFLLTASNHFAKDLFCKFKHLLDIACIIQKEGSNINGETIIKTAKQFGFYKRLMIGLHVTNDLLGIKPVWLTNDYKEEAKLYIGKVLQQPLYIHKNYITDTAFLKHAYRLQDGTSKKIGFVYRCMVYIFIPTELDLNTFKLPAFCLPLLFLLRPFRLLFETTLKAFGAHKKL